MLRVIDLLALPIFENFRLVSNAEGLYNRIEGVGVLDWESPKEIRETFSPNDIVFTTMYMLPGDFEKANIGMDALIKLRVGALAIKTTDPDICPQEVIDKANLYRIPVFTYEKEYLEDLIYVVKSSIDASDANGISLDILKRMMAEGPDQTVALAGRLNPLFRNNLTVICCVPAGKDSDEVLDEALNSYRKTLPQNMPNPKSHDSVIRCEKCMLIIHTSNQPESADPEALEKRCAEVLKELNIDSRKFCTGLSGYKTSLLDIREAIDEAVTASLDGLLAGDRFRHYAEAGTSALIIPGMESKGFSELYNRFLATLESYDSTHESALLDTLMAYVESDWDISLTATRLYQHSNTVRYRLAKARQLLGLDAGPEGQLQMFVFARMHKLRTLLGGDRII